MEHPYVTYDNDYIESVWWIVKQLWDNGPALPGLPLDAALPALRHVALATHEVALGYKEDTPDPSVYVKFRLTDGVGGAAADARRRLDGDGPCQPRVAWTTTPWTLPGNTALAVKPDAEYGIYRARAASCLVVATAARPRRCSARRRRDGALRCTGEALVGLKYEPLYDPTAWGVPAMWFDPAQDGRLVAGETSQTVEAAYTVLAGEFVSLEDGTGIVHIAPAFGGEDFELGKEHGLLFLQPVDLRGLMPAGSPWAGQVREGRRPADHRTT